MALSKVQSVDQRMRLECGVGFRQLRRREQHLDYSITSSAVASRAGSRRGSARSLNIMPSTRGDSSLGLGGAGRGE